MPGTIATRDSHYFFGSDPTNPSVLGSVAPAQGDARRIAQLGRPLLKLQDDLLRAMSISLLALNVLRWLNCVQFRLPPLLSKVERTEIGPSFYRLKLRQHPSNSG